MTNNLTLKNEQVAAYLATKDSLLALEKAVDNGQTRLSLQVLVDVIDELFERLVALEQLVINTEDNQEDTYSTPAPAETVSVKSSVEEKKKSATENENVEINTSKEESGKSVK